MFHNIHYTFYRIVTKKCFLNLKTVITEQLGTSIKHNLCQLVKWFNINSLHQLKINIGFNVTQKSNDRELNFFDKFGISLG